MSARFEAEETLSGVYFCGQRICVAISLNQSFAKDRAVRTGRKAVKATVWEILQVADCMLIYRK